jgi:Glycosyl transferase family 2
MGNLMLGMALLSIAIWLGLLTLWGGFWRCNQRLDGKDTTLGDTQREPSFPNICAIIPARNEADVLPQTVRSLLSQTYPGHLQIVLVDDQSTDGTGEVARQTAAELHQSEKLTVINAEPLPAGWTGKLWAMEQGVRYIQALTPLPDYVLFSDADIAHDPDNLFRLATKAKQDDLDLVSLMVLLRCQSVWEKFLIPAFVFFFQKLYPFPLVNNPKSRIAAAAGGCILMRRSALEQIGGLQILRQALIDDCSLAIAIKAEGRRQKAKGKEKAEDVGCVSPSVTHRKDRETEKADVGCVSPSVTHRKDCETEKAEGSADEASLSGKIWLGLTQTTLSLRPYDSLQTIWDMVARTAYTQLGYSPLLLVGTVLGMALVYLVAPIAVFIGLFTTNWLLCGMGVVGWLLMAIAYLPTIQLYQLSPLWAICLPAIALLYNLMTIDSALRHWRGQGGAWKGRVYPQK